MDTEDLLIALDEWFEAKTELNACYKNAYSSPSYHCWRYAEREKEARGAVEKALENIIDFRIELATGARP